MVVHRFTFFKRIRRVATGNINILHVADIGENQKKERL